MNPTHIIKEIGPKSALYTRRKQLEGQECRVILDSSASGIDGWFMGKVELEHWPSKYCEQNGYIILFQARLEAIE